MKYCSRRTRYDRHGANFDNFEKTTLFMAVEKSDVAIVKLLLGNKNIDINNESLFNSYYIYDSGESFNYLYKRTGKIYYDKCGLPNNNDDEIIDEYDVDIEQYDQYYPIETLYKKPRRFPLGKMTPFLLAEKHNNNPDIIVLLSK